MVKQLIYKLFEYLGVNQFVRFIARDRIVILMLHGVGPKYSDSVWRPGWGRPSSEEMDLVVSAYKKHFTFISIDTAVNMLTGKIPCQKNCMVLTFDDGYKNNIEQAWPVLKNHDIPMIIYPTSAGVSTQKPYWIDRLDYALQSLSSEDYELNLSKIACKIRTSPFPVFVEDYKKARIKIKSSYDNDYEMLADIAAASEQLENVSGKQLADICSEDVWSAILTEHDLAQLPDLITIGSHTVNHTRTTHISSEDLERELSESKSALESWTNKSCDHFCYPNGDFNAVAARTVKKTGYISAVSTKRGLNKCGDDLFTLRRIPFPRARSKHQALFKLSCQLWKYTWKRPDYYRDQA